MKTILSTNPTFTPASKTLNFSGVSGFAINRLLAVLDQTTNTIIYAQSGTGLGYASWVSGTGVLTLQKDTTTGGYSFSDSLTCIYDDPAATMALIGSTTGGASTYHIGSTLASISSFAIKASPGTIYGITVSSNNVDNGFGIIPAFLKFYDTATPQVGGGSATIPVYTVPIVATSAYASNAIIIPQLGIKFSTAIYAAITGGQSDADQTAPQAGHTININYV